MKNRNISKRKDFVESSKNEREDLRGEIRRLRKEVLQLRKINATLSNRDSELQELLEDVTIEDVTEHKRKCPVCKTSQINVVEKLRGDKDYFFCQNQECNARGELK